MISNIRKMELGTHVSSLCRADYDGRGVVLKRYKAADKCQFNAEIQALPALQGCKEIVSLLKVDRDYFIMDFYPNGDLFSKVEAHRVIPVPHVKKYARALLRAIAACHDAGFAHMDIKLDNILLAADGSLRLTDFGMSIKSERNNTQRGTVDYMAPEVLHPHFEGHQYNTFSADMWSFAICIFILLTGNPPFHRASVECPCFKAFRSTPAHFWSSFRLADDAIEFLQSLLVVMRTIDDVRPSAAQTLDHPWLQGEVPADFF
jgi:5'-AMP-activated protein kinase catalytic alpha subunit